MIPIEADYPGYVPDVPKEEAAYEQWLQWQEDQEIEALK